MHTRKLEPFGVELEGKNENPIDCDILMQTIHQALERSPLVVLRESIFPNDDNFRKFATSFGEPMKWEFGDILDLHQRPNPENHIFSGGRVELHWDGAFTTKKPDFNIFYCLEGLMQEDGGETIFVDTRKILAKLTYQQRQAWSSYTLRYRTEKKAHYGGTITEKLIQYDQTILTEVLRYIEAFNEDNAEVNPLDIAVIGQTQEQSNIILRELNTACYQPDVLYAHRWQKGDVLIANNRILLHGRNASSHQRSARHLKRIHILMNNDGVQKHLLDAAAT